MRKLFALLLACVMVLGLFGCTKTPTETTPTGTEAPATEAPVTEAPVAETQGDIAILFTNDVHTYIDNPLSYDVIAGLKAELKNQYE